MWRAAWCAVLGVACSDTWHRDGRQGAAAAVPSRRGGGGGGGQTAAMPCPAVPTPPFWYRMPSGNVCCLSNAVGLDPTGWYRAAVVESGRRSLDGLVFVRFMLAVKNVFTRPHTYRTLRWSELSPMHGRRMHISAVTEEAIEEEFAEMWSKLALQQAEAVKDAEAAAAGTARSAGWRAVRVGIVPLRVAERAGSRVGC